MEIEEIIRLLPLLLGGKASKEQEKEVSRWLEEDEGNPVLYKELCATYYKLHYACRWTDIDPVAASSKIRSGLEKKSVRLRLTAWVSGVAAILVVGLCISYFIHREDSVIPERIIVKDVKSGEKKALLTLADGRQVELKADHQVNMDLGTVTAIEDSLVGLVYQVKDSSKTPLEYHQLSVPRAGEYIMTLSDGTKVWLNSETEMKYPVVFDRGKREVFITGEAFFEVVKDSARPFIVHTPHTHTTVLGTSFNVKAYRDEQSVFTTLVEGSVLVEVTGNGDEPVARIMLEPGMQAAWQEGDRAISVQPVNAANVAAWKDGKFIFTEEDLEKVLRVLSRWYGVNFICKDSQMEKYTFNGLINKDEKLESVLENLTLTGGPLFNVVGKNVYITKK